MIITRTPYRVSFFGGGTDYHTWYQEHGAAVLATTINHYCYLSCRFLPPFFNYKSRIVWSKVECVAALDYIEHPSVRAALKYLDIDYGVEIHHQGDLPARSGLGSSSAFTVGLLNALYAQQGMMVSKQELACEAVHVERDILHENVGVQDQITTAFGGFNKIVIQPDGNFQVQPIILPLSRLKQLQKHLLLFFTGISRTASDIAGEKMKMLQQKQDELLHMRKLVDEATTVLMENKDLCEFGKLLHETWQLKRAISAKISPSFVDDIYTKARSKGALGGKLLGAGGGGFMLFFVEPQYQSAVLDVLDELLVVPFEFETSGSQVIFCDHAQYSRSSLYRRNFRHLQNDKSQIGNAQTKAANFAKHRRTQLSILPIGKTPAFST